MIRGVYLNSMTEDWSEVLNIRKAVFEDELLYKVTSDSEDATAIQILLYDENDQPAGSARLSFDLDGHFRFDYLCVLEGQRHKGFADFMMHMIFDKARMSGAVYLESSQLFDNAGYFKKYGFVDCKNGSIQLDINQYFNDHKCCH